MKMAIFQGIEHAKWFDSFYKSC